VGDFNISSNFAHSNFSWRVAESVCKCHFRAEESIGIVAKRPIPRSPELENDNA
jgi:hypothetical protein